MSNSFFADEETAYAKDTRAQAQNQVDVSVIQSCFHNNGYVKYALAQSQRTTPNLVYLYFTWDNLRKSLTTQTRILFTPTIFENGKSSNWNFKKKLKNAILVH